jgi:hypothetical protein
MARKESRTGTAALERGSIARKMAWFALVGDAKPRSKKTKARISRVLSDHTIANTWWDASSLPSWLTERFYVEQIQPLLRDKKVRDITEVMRVSKPYAAFIRSGRRRPHPRHWQALAGLVGVTN